MQINNINKNPAKELWEKLFQSSKVRMILQSEAAECGLACLCMVASYHGQNRTLSELRRLFSVSMKGTNLKSIMEMADSLGLSARPLRLEVEELVELKTPCILHWDLTHFVVLVKATNKYIEINDPARGKLKLTYNEIDKSFTGVALELTPTPKFEKKEHIERVKLTDMWSSMRGLATFMWQLGGLALVVQLFAIVSPMLNQLIMDDAIVKGDLDLLSTIAIGMIILMLIKTAIGLIQSFVGLYLGTQLSFQMQSNLLRHALRLPVSWFEKRHLGDIMSRFGSLGPVQGFITGVPIGFALNSIMCVAGGVMMFLYSPILSLAVIASLIIPYAVRAITFPYIRRKTNEGISLGAQASTVFMETIRGARTFKLFGKEQERVTQWQNDQIAATNNSVELSKFGLWGGAGMGIVTGLQGVAVWYLGAQQVITGKLSLGMLMAFQSYAGQFTGALGGIIGVYFQWKTLELHLERLADVIHEDLEPGTDDPINNARIVNGNIGVKNLSFRYATHEPFVFENAELDIKEGEFVAIIGPSGGGKTTLLKNLVGILQPTDGEVIIENLSMKGFGLRNFRNQIGVVMQDDRLFQGTIADNVSFFDTDMELTRVEDALKLACVYDEIMKMPMGLETLVGDMGSTLSGGQAQRVLIARALYRNPKILFLDEGTAHLDPETERRIAENLRNLKITRISVAHREVAIEGANRVFRVENKLVSEIME